MSLKLKNKKTRILLLASALILIAISLVVVYVIPHERYPLTLGKMFGDKIYEIPSVKGHKIDNLIILPAGTEISSYIENPVLVPMVSNEKEVVQKKRITLYKVNVNNVLRCSPQLLVWGDKSVKEVFGRLHNMSCYLIDKKDLLPDPLAKHTIVVLDGYIKADAGCEIGIKGEIKSKGKEEFISLKEGSKISFVLTQPFIVDSSKIDKGENK